MCYFIYICIYKEIYIYFFSWPDKTDALVLCKQDSIHQVKKHKPHN